MSERERQCSNCGRIYSEADWQEANCPFCDIPLEDIGSDKQLLSDTLSTQLTWPAGEREVLAGYAEGYLNGQLLKAALEAEGIPVLLQGGTIAQVWGVSMGSAAEIRILVPESRVEEAKQIIQYPER